MEQHPVPQQISSYQFRLVGDMTLKQFMELAAGALIGLLIYSSALHPIIKWPLIIVSVLFGAALAFLPFEDRPLEIWVVAFFRSIYSPTLYFWSKTQKKEQYFQEETGQALPLNVIAPHGQAALNKYLHEKPGEKQPFFVKLEDAEKVFLSKVTGLFAQFNFKGQPPTAAQTTTQVVTPTSTPVFQTTVVETPSIVQAQPQAQTVPTPQVIPAFNPLLSTPQVQKAPEVRTAVNIPATEFIKVATSKPLSSATPTEIFTQSEPIQTVAVNPTVMGGQTTGTVQQAEFSVSASPPMPPTQSNTLSGQVMDAAGRIIESAILEIKDAAGRPVRAVKTNKLGHFFIVTPLANGGYEILTEKDDYAFDTVRFVAEGKIIPPIAIRSRGAMDNNPIANTSRSIM